MMEGTEILVVSRRCNVGPCISNALLILHRWVTLSGILL